tara:strand:+ start:896 stop:1033 length:138 start_codon:yes stop_codon:yes gene_type:complete
MVKEADREKRRMLIKGTLTAAPLIVTVPARKARAQGSGYPTSETA